METTNTIQQFFDNLKYILYCSGFGFLVLAFIFARIRERRYYNSENPITIGGYPSKGIRIKPKRKGMLIVAFSCWILATILIYVIAVYYAG